MIYRETVRLDDPSFIQTEIIDDGRPWADIGPLLDCMCEMFREHLTKGGEKVASKGIVVRG